jgi:hypothetical protein
MSQSRYNAALQEFIRQWRPRSPVDLDVRFVDDVRKLVSAILCPPAGTFEVTTILSPSGGKVLVRLADYEAQLDPLDAQHLALSLVEGATSARTESWLYRFMQEQLEAEPMLAARMVGEFRNYRIEEMQRELDGDFERRSVPPKPKEPSGGEA